MTMIYTSPRTNKQVCLCGRLPFPHRPNTECETVAEFHGAVTQLTCASPTYEEIMVYLEPDGSNYFTALDLMVKDLTAENEAAVRY